MALCMYIQCHFLLGAVGCGTAIGPSAAVRL